MVRSPREKKPRGKALPRHILCQLSAALENPNIKALEWDEDGRGVVVHAELYEEEMQKNKELFPELKDLRSVSALQVWLLAYGFQLKEANLMPGYSCTSSELALSPGSLFQSCRVDSQILVFQHTDFQKPPPKAEETDALRGNSGLSATHQKKRKRGKKMGSLFSPTASSGRAGLNVLGRRPRLRPLYQYINLDSLEPSYPSEEECEAAGQAEPDRVAGASGRATTLEMESELQGGTWASSTPEIPVPAVDDISTQVDVEKMLSVCTTHLVPPLSPQYK